MKVSEQSKALPQASAEVLSQPVAGSVATQEKHSLSKMVAGTFGKFDIAVRARLLARLLASVGPLALKVVSAAHLANMCDTPDRPRSRYRWRTPRGGRRARYLEPSARLGTLRRAERS